LEGIIEHKFPPGLKHNEHYIIKGLGLRKPNLIDKGDLHLLINIDPISTNKSKDLKEEFEKIFKKISSNKI